MNKLKSLLRVVAPLLVLALGVGVAVALIESKPQAARRPPAAIAPLVEVVTTAPTTEQVTVEAVGTVGSSHVVAIIPQVSGRLTSVHPALVAGGLISAGETLVEIDPRDYELRVSQLKAQVARARVDLRLELSRKRVAAREWAALESSAEDAGEGETDRELALRDPQIAAARAALSSAQSAVKEARLALERTTITAPFNAYVRDEMVEVGQLVAPGSKLATLVSTDSAWIEVAVGVDRIDWIAIPHTNADEGSLVQLVQDGRAGSLIERQGRVLRLLPELEPRGRLARLLIEVQDPFGLQGELSDRGTPLLIGAFVKAAIVGRTLQDVIGVPRTALRDGDQVWVVDQEGTLQVKPVVVQWRETARVLVSGGLAAGERVITSPLSAPVPGMPVRVAGEAQADAKAIEAKPEVGR